MIKSRWQLANAALRDASVAGFQVAVDQDFSVGDEVELAVDLPGERRVHCEGRVVREARRPPGQLEPRGYGVRISRIEKREHDTLRTWLRASGDRAPRGVTSDRTDELQELTVRLRRAHEL